ncbi:hypothetical protein AB9J70_06245 [Elizabethkingia anophelis]|uniref:hypothetical protein n=1 Tax=Elizabethkingia anophelis TaxID=1117645 RepID=UPI003558F5F6
MKTKYIAVPVSERLPEKSGFYYIKHNNHPDLEQYDFFDDLHDGEYFETEVEWWLEEKEDHSEEILSVLSEVMRFKHELRMIMSDKLQYPDNFLKALTDAEQLINKVKDNEK